MARSAGKVHVQGLADLQRELRSIDAKLPRELRRTNLEAAQLVATAARNRAFALGGVASHVAPSIKAAAEQRAAKIAFGGARWPMAMGANFGAGHDTLRHVVRQGRGVMVRGWNQFPEWGGNQFTGGANDRFIYRTIAATRDRFMDEYQQMLDALMRRAFPN